MVFIIFIKYFSQNYANNELLEKRSVMLKYESNVWMMTIQVLGGMLFIAFLIGSIYECCRRKKNKIQGLIIYFSYWYLK